MPVTDRGSRRRPGRPSNASRCWRAAPAPCAVSATTSAGCRIGSPPTRRDLASATCHHRPGAGADTRRPARPARARPRQRHVLLDRGPARRDRRLAQLPRLRLLGAQPRPHPGQDSRRGPDGRERERSVPAALEALAETVPLIVIELRCWHGHRRGPAHPRGRVANESLDLSDTPARRPRRSAPRPTGARRRATRRGHSRTPSSTG